MQSMVHGSVTTTYGYNTEDQLTAASGSGTGASSYSYSYDADGNLLSENLAGTTRTMTYNTADELCWTYIGTSSNACGSAPSGSVTYSYDNAGNQTTNSAGQNNAYNTLNQASSMTNSTGGSSTSMAYTGIDNALRVTDGSTTETNNAFGVAATTTSGTTTYFTDDPTGRHNSLLVGSSRYYYLYDGQGNVVGLINSSGTQDAIYTYDPYGDTTTSGTESGANPFRYQAGYQDATADYHFGDRYYNPSLGEWTQVDPAGISGGYSFSFGNPINLMDPDGDQPVSAIIYYVAKAGEIIFSFFAPIFPGFGQPYSKSSEIDEPPAQSSGLGYYPDNAGDGNTIYIYEPSIGDGYLDERQ